jgi:putative hydrolase of the HAD superfamily
VSPDARAVVFDLDDTLYPYRRFVRSGFGAVATYLAREYAVPAEAVFRALVRAARGDRRGRELQAAVDTFSLPPGALVETMHVMYEHVPQLRLPAPARDALRLLRAADWRLGVLTNGVPDVQARKIAALGLGRHVDAVVYAAECGSGAGKPDPQPFDEIARRLSVHPDRIVVVGNDERCDIVGAIRAGMWAIRCNTWTMGPRPSAAHAMTRQLRDVPRLAHSLIPEVRHAA